MTQSSDLPIAITLGDPAGVGPEVTCKALARMSLADRARTLVVGDIAVLRAADRIVGSNLTFAETATPRAEGQIGVEHIAVGQAVEFGRIDPAFGDAAFRYIKHAVELAQAGRIGCIVTAPIHKEALNLAGHHYDGHTGMLAALTGSRASFMLLASERLSVVHVSTHVALRDAITRATPERVLATIRIGHQHLRRMGLANPRIAVAGINPHCGENGLFGREDDLQVAPAVAMAQAEGINVSGPIPPDTVFHRAYNGAFDLVVAQYHDQGHIPMKLVAFETGVNISLGMPIERTSVDHGTAFDIAGTGKANHVNMTHAIAYARKLAATPKPQAGDTA